MAQTFDIEQSRVYRTIVKKASAIQSQKKIRIEKDSIGKIKVPQEAYYGSFTARALKNFEHQPEAQHRTLKNFQIQLGYIKIASAQTNELLKRLDKKLSTAIQNAAREFIAGKFDKDFKLNIFQAGAGTPFNMNTNEIIANRANELLSGKKGSYEFVHPNNHVNMSQSSNDIIPTAIRLTVLSMQKTLKEETGKLIETLEKKSHEFSKILKTGRTHLQDAVPITLGQEFSSFAQTLKKDIQNLESTEKLLKEIGLGGTALGTGINTHPDYQKTVVKILSKLTVHKLGHRLIPAKNLFEITGNMNAFLNISSAYRQIATTLQRIAEDLKLLSMSAIAEISLPEVEPGSSIMPGKINPGMCEYLQMICYQVLGNDHAVALACQKGQLELNVMTPLILKNLTDSIELLETGMKNFRQFCITGIKANPEKCQKLLEKSNCVATALSPHLGYAKTAELLKEALKRKMPIEKLCEEKKFLPTEKLKEILDPEKLTRP